MHSVLRVVFSRSVLWLLVVVIGFNLWDDGVIVTAMATSSSSSPNNKFSLSSTTIPPLLNVPTYSMATLNINIDDNEDEESTTTQTTTQTTTNMNIVTYATPVSTGGKVNEIQQPRVWCISLFKGTKTELNFRHSKTCILQVLTKRHSSIVPILGSTSGRNDNSMRKSKICEENGLQWISFKDITKIQDEDDNIDDDNDMSSQQNLLLSNISVLPHCAYYIHLTAVGDFVDAGSHVIVPYCKVDGMYVPSTTTTTTTTTHDDENDDNNDNNDQDDNDGQQDYELLMTGYLREVGIITKLGRVTEGLV